LASKVVYNGYNLLLGNLKVPGSLLYAINRDNPQISLKRLIMPLTLLPFVLLIVPILEIGVFIVVGGEIGALWTIALVLLTAVLGSILLRIEGFRTFAKIREKLNSGQIPGEELAKGAMILVAGALLLTPGFITDGIGFALFIPAIRKLIWLFLAKRITTHTMSAPGSSAFADRADNNQNPDIVDLDPDDFQEQPNESSPWHTDHDDRKRS
jgi:UPF0716 protein FxsA